MNKPIDHHYVPRFYLSKWCGADNKIQYFRRINNQLISSRISPKNTAFEPNLYSLEHVSSEEEQIIEKFLNENIDSPASRVLDKMITGGIEKLSIEERKSFGKFLISLRYRGPKSVSDIRSDGFDEVMKMLVDGQEEYEALRTSDEYPTTFKEFAEQTHPGLAQNFGIEQLSSWMCDSGNIDHIAKMHWWVAEIGDAGFDLLTSDHPSVYTLGVGHPRCIIALALGPDKIFFASNNPAIEDQIMRCSYNKIVKHFNTSVVSQAFDKVYAKDEKQYRFIKNRLKKLI